MNIMYAFESCFSLSLFAFWLQMCVCVCVCVCVSVCACAQACVYKSVQKVDCNLTQKYLFVIFAYWGHRWNIYGVQNVLHK